MTLHRPCRLQLLWTFIITFACTSLLMQIYMSSYHYARIIIYQQNKHNVMTNHTLPTNYHYDIINDVAEQSCQILGENYTKISAIATLKTYICKGMSLFT